MSEQDDLWYITISLYSSTEDFEVQTFCNQCGKIVLQKLSEKICPYCKSEKWTRAEMTREVRQMLEKIGQDVDFTHQLKLKYKKIWNEKFPKYAIPPPDKVGRLV